VAYIYQYRVTGEQKVWQVRSNYEQNELRAKLEAKVGELDLLMLVRSATQTDSRLPYVDTTGVSTAAWDQAVANLRGDHSKDSAGSWDDIMATIRGKDKVVDEPVTHEPATDTWADIVKKVTKPRKTNA
jgi:hypothetical protein